MVGLIYGLGARRDPQLVFRAFVATLHALRMRARGRFSERAP